MIGASSCFRSVVAAVFFAGIAASALAQPHEIKVVGTGDGVDLMRGIADEFQKQRPNVLIDIPPSIGSGGGIAAVGAGKAVLGRVARPLSDAERSSQIEYVPFARIPSAILVHPSTGVIGLTSDQLADIYSGKVGNWKDVGGADLRIRRVRRENEDSTLLALRNAMPGWKTLAITENAKMAVTTQDSLETVRETAGAIGFGPFSRQLGSGLVVLRIDGTYPDEPGYPSNVELALVYRQDLSDSDVKAFINYVSSDAARNVMRTFGAVPIVTRK